MKVQRQQKPRVQPKAKTSQWRRFKGMNRTDARPSIDDDELYWLENVIPVGNGSLQIIAGNGTSIAVGAAGRSIWGGTINGEALLLVVCSDGSIIQVTPGGIVTTAAPAGSVTVDARIASYRGERFLIIDPVEGYYSYEPGGAGFVVIDASRTGTGLAVFEGRVWIVEDRTIIFTAPNSYNDFDAADGGGSSIITDDAFQGNITAIYSALEQLWVVGHSAIEAIGNVASAGTAPNVVTTFTITNIVTNLGSSAPSSVIAYFRALALLAPFGAYALSGVTPQKLSDKLDGLFPNLTFTDAPAAVGTVQNLLVLAWLVTYTGADLASAWGATTMPLLLCFTQGKWFVATASPTLAGITTLVVDGVPRIYGLDTAATVVVYPLFSGPADQAVNYKVQSKLYDFGSSTTAKALMKVGLEFQAVGTVAPEMTVDSEFGSVSVDVSSSNTLTIVNAVGATLQLVNALGDPLNLVGQGTVLSRQRAQLGGRYLGWTIQGTDVPYRIQAVQFEVVPTREWQA